MSMRYGYCENDLGEDSDNGAVFVNGRDANMHRAARGE